MNIDLGQPIAYGRTAEVYAWQAGQVLKLFYDWFEPENIHYEARISRAIYASGLPVPAVGELLELNDRTGLVYQRVNGEAMWNVLIRKPWRVLQSAYRTAALHFQIHTATTQANIPSLQQKLAYKIRLAESLPEHLRSRTLAELETMPDGDRLCHGDFHPINILITTQGEVIIDWIDAACGNPLADVARSSVIILGAVACQFQDRYKRGLLRIFHAAYIRKYFKLNPVGQDQYYRWLPIIAAARLSENIPEIQAWLIDQVVAAYAQ